MSRHPDELEPLTDMGDETEAYVAFISEHSIPRAMSRAELIEHTRTDKTLKILGSFVKEEQINSEEHETIRYQYGKILNELTVTNDGIVLRGCRIVLPASLELRALMLAHEGHQGITKTKSLLRTKVWFVGMDSKVEEFLKTCLACQLIDTSTRKEPCLSTPLTENPWTHLSMDMFGPIPTGQELAVVMDEYSKFPVVFEVPTTIA